jgi:hypothetical protein
MPARILPPLALGLTLLLSVTARADQVSGTIKSVDPEARTIVVSTKAEGTSQEVTLKVDRKTQAENHKGKARKKFSLDRLRVGGSIDATRENGVVTKIVLAKGALKKKEK